MGCGSFGVAQVLVGLHRVGVVGLKPAITEVLTSGIDRREQIIDALCERLRDDNYLPDAQAEEFRKALWREVLRHRGEDFSDFYSEVEVTVHGDEGAQRDRFVELLTDVFADFELRPVCRFAPPLDDGVHPLLVAGENVVARGVQTRANLKSAVRRSFSDW
jgi:hypothetical protein